MTTVERFRWRDLRQFDANLIQKILLWQGWISWPSVCAMSRMMTGRCTHCWRRQRKAERLRRKTG